MPLKDNVCIVTGGGQGIGRAIALAFAKRDAEVVIFDIDADKAEETSNEIRSFTGRKTLMLSGDVSKNEDVERMVVKTVEEFGRIDILVNNAGIWRDHLVIDMNENDWDRVFAVNVKGVFLCSQAVAKEMVTRKQGKIINISSVAGKGSGAETWSAYCASKAAVIMFSMVLAKELKPFGITVNALCPGATDTALLHGIISTQGGDYSHAAGPEAVAEAVALLSSDVAEGVTGGIFDGPPWVDLETLTKNIQEQREASTS